MRLSKVLSICTIVSYFTNFLLDFKYLSKSLSKERWIYLGSKKSYSSFIKEIKLQKINYIFDLFYDSNELKKISDKNNKGIIIEDPKILKNKKLRNLFIALKNKIKITTRINWCEIYLGRIPSNF